MHIADIIRKKRDGLELSTEEIRFFVEGVTQGTFPDYQTSAFLMATFFQGMTDAELFTFTEAMVHSGDVLDISSIEGITCDKHSTGGVGDKLTLIVLPLVASLGIKMPKMSGRGLGFSGGTVDKLESIPGFQTVLSKEAFIRQVNDIGLGVIAQSGNLAPADKKLYALRDVTATVESIPLIGASVVSKKIASGNRHIVFDIKVGNGAFMKDIKEALSLGRAMVEMVKKFGGNSLGVLSNMNVPLGHYVGNSLEIREVIETLKGEGPQDLVELTQVLGAALLKIGGRTETVEEGKSLVKEVLSSGKGLDLFQKMIEAQGGNGDVVNDLSLLPVSSEIVEIRSKVSGYVADIKAMDIGIAAGLLGAGRQSVEDRIDLGAGIRLHKKVGDRVFEGEVLATGYYSPETLKGDRGMIEAMIFDAYGFSSSEVLKEKMVYEIIG